MRRSWILAISLNLVVVVVVVVDALSASFRINYNFDKVLLFLFDDEEAAWQAGNKKEPSERGCKRRFQPPSIVSPF